MIIKTRTQEKREAREELVKRLWKDRFNVKKGKGNKTLIAEQIAKEVDTSLTTVLRIIKSK